MNTLANMIAYYNNGEHDVYHFVLGKILENTDLFLYGSIYEIADYCASSTATISRLSQKLGYKNFTDFRHNLYDAFHHYQYSNPVMPDEFIRPMEELRGGYFDNLREILRRVELAVTEDQLSEAVEMLHEAKHVRIFPFNTGFTDTALQINLLMTGKESRRCDRFMDQMKAAKELTADDVVIIMAPDCSDALDVIPLSQVIREHGAKMILITNSPHCIHIKRADLSITFEGNGSNLDLWGMYMIVDLITLTYRKRYIE